MGLPVIPPGVHEYVEAPLAVITAGCPAQIVGELAVTTGLGFTATVSIEIVVHPAPSVTVAV